MNLKLEATTRGRLSSSHDVPVCGAVDPQKPGFREESSRPRPAHQGTNVWLGTLEPRRENHVAAAGRHPARAPDYFFSRTSS